jgi:hypothetical protein
MDKSEIISEIKKMKELNGKPPGWGTFQKATGVKKSDWFPDYWFRWSDAIEEAGFKPNEFIQAHTEEFIIQRLVELIEELNHFPIDAELVLRKKNDESFPNTHSFYKLGSKRERIELTLNYLRDQNEKDYKNVILICEEELKISLKPKVKKTSIDSATIKKGFVYLLKHGSRNEYKIGKTFNPLRREGEIKIELPEKVKPVHYIETDDPSGIEAYWHNRFKEKRTNGEWFNLLSADIKAFKRWKRIY